MKILVLGAGGFIGSNLVEHLLTATEHRLIGVDNDDEKVRDIDPQDGRFQFLHTDVRELRDNLNELIEDSDVVMDLIAYANPSAYIARPLDVVDLNFFQNLKLVDFCIQQHKRLIQFSTCEVYGQSDGRRQPFNEDTSHMILGPVQHQRWIYASAKELLERIIYAHGQNGELDFTTIRPFNFVGPKIDYLVESGSVGGPRVFSHFLSALITGGPLRLVDGGSAQRSFTDISDACEAIRLIIESPDACHNQIINIGNPANGTTIRDLAYLMLSLYEEISGEKARSQVEDIAGTDFYGAGYEDCDWRIPDIRKISALGWQPKFDLTETFRRAMVWHLDSLAEEGSLPSYLRASPVAGKRP